MQKYVEQEASKVISDSDQEAFMEDVIEDLEQVDESRLVGLGLTPEQLKKWLSI